jgi:hypothetical protein
LIDPLGIEIYGAKVPDQLDLSFLSIPFEIDIEQSYFPSGVSLLNTQLPALYLMGSYLANPNPTEYALNAYGIKVDGGVFLRNGFTATANINLAGSIIGGDINFNQAIFPKKTEIDADSSAIKGTFWWTQIVDGSQVELDLMDTSAGSLTDDKDSWPTIGSLSATGFTYDHFEMRTDTGAVMPRDADSGLIWLRLQGHDGWSTQPYEQLAKVLEGEGYDSGARQIQIAMEDDLPRSQFSWYQRIWLGILKYTIAYGYEPWLALW